MRVLAIIPARYQSTRFPGKPLAQLGGMSVIERVYRRVESVVGELLVATDDERIKSAVESFGGHVVMTSKDHTSGTDRSREAYELSGVECDVVINVQGDEPFIEREQIEMLISCFTKPECEIATLVQPFKAEDGIEALENPNSPKVVIDKNMRAIYFSRSVIPYLRGVERKEWLTKHTFYKHIGIYAFRPEVLKAITRLEPSSLERGENLEQLRWIECGYNIGVGITSHSTIGIDTPEDLAAAERFLASREDK